MDDTNESRTIDLLSRNPYMRSADPAEALGVSLPTANKLLSRKESEGIVRGSWGKSATVSYPLRG